MGILDMYHETRDHNTRLANLWFKGEITSKEMFMSAKLLTGVGTRDMRVIQPREAVWDSLAASVRRLPPLFLIENLLASEGRHFPVDRGAYVQA